jgi:pimeloyl-ACP methyl ester carboxylesterase
MMKQYMERPSEIEEKPERGMVGRLGRTLVIGGAMAGAVAGANALVAARAGTPRHEVGGVFARYPWRFGDLAYTLAGKGTPMVLVHGLGAGNSMAEWSEAFPLLRQHFTTYAFDFLGWGLSDQPDIEYVASDYVSQLVGFIEDIVGEPCIVVASSDGCDYAIQAAARMPNLISQLVLVCPPLVPKQQAAAPLAKVIETILAWPVIGATLNNLLTSQRSIDGFARRQLFYDKSLSGESFIKRHSSRAHRGGSRRSLATFLSGRARVDAREEWSRLEQPALLVWGRNATLNSLETAPEWLALKPDARLEVIEEAMLLPHYEHPREWTNRVLDWLQQPSAQSTWPPQEFTL